MATNIHDGHRLRIKERFLVSGLDSFHPHEALELLLFYCVPRKDTNPLAHRLIDRFGSLAAVINAEYDRLLAVDGVTENVATFFVLLKDTMRRYQRESVQDTPRFDSFEEFGNFVKAQFFGEQIEKVRLFCLNNRGDLLGCSVISEGTPDATPVNVRAIIETALRYPTTKAIIAHNHPAGFAIPSDADAENTLLVRRALENINVQLVDHLVVSEDEFVSMRQSSKYTRVFSMYAMDDSAPFWLR